MHSIVHGFARKVDRLGEFVANICWYAHIIGMNSIRCRPIRMPTQIEALIIECSVPLVVYRHVSVSLERTNVLLLLHVWLMINGRR